MLNRVVLPSVAFVVVFAILCGLGFWQVQRLHWKEALIARVETRFDRAPTPLPSASAWSEPSFLDGLEYTPVTVRGTFVVPPPDSFESFYVYTLLAEPRGPLGGQGYFVMSLFRAEGGGELYVNRGFVEGAARGSEAPPPAGTVTLTGVVRAPSTGNSFTPPCEVEQRTCFVADIAKAAGFAGIEDVAPFYLDLRADGIAGADASAGGGVVPQAGETRISFANNHLQYVVTWFGLAAALAGVFAVFMAGRLRRG